MVIYQKKKKEKRKSKVKEIEQIIQMELVEIKFRSIDSSVESINPNAD